MNFLKVTILLIFCCCRLHISAQSSKDTVSSKTNKVIDSAKLSFAASADTLKSTITGSNKKSSKHEPGKATMRSLILPGWGQAYNKRYWEIPLVYGALGITGAIYLYNNKWYKKTRDAYDIKVNRPQDIALIDPRLEPLSPGALEVYRNSFRRDRDYSALWFVIFWALNVVDATVFAHLKAFDVSEDLSIKINPVLNSNGSKGFSLAMGYKSNVKREQRFVIP